MMSARFAFAIGAFVLILGTADYPVRADEDGSPHEAASPDSEAYARPGSSVRDEQGRLVKLWLEAPDDATLREVVKQSLYLKLLGLRDCRASRAGLWSLRGLKHLQDLEFRDPGPNMKPVDLIHLLKIERLQTLSFPSMSLAIHCLKRDEQGSILAIRMYRPDDTMLARAFVELPHLTSLSIMDGEFTENGFRTIKHLKQLEELALIHRHRNFTGTSPADVAEVPALKRLRLKATGIGNDDVVHLEGHPQLVELDIGTTKVGDLGEEQIVRLCPHLEELDVSGLAVTNRSARAIARLNKLRKLDIATTSIDDDGLASLAKLPDLQGLG